MFKISEKDWPQEDQERCQRKWSLLVEAWKLAEETRRQTDARIEEQRRAAYDGCAY